MHWLKLFYKQNMNNNLIYWYCMQVFLYGAWFIALLLLFKNKWEQKWGIANSVLKNYLENVLTQTKVSTSHRLTSASTLPVAKYFPVLSNSMHIQLAGCAFKICFICRSGYLKDIKIFKIK